MIGVYNKSVILTYVGLACSIIGMYFAYVKNIDFSMICLILAGICDLFDGVVARKCKRSDMEKEIGIQLDSLVDVVSFGIFPVVIFMNLELKGVLNCFVFILYTMFAISRLAYFNVHASKDTPVKSYVGLPVTTVAFLFPLLYLLHHFMNQIIFGRVLIIGMFVIAILFVAKIKIPKPHLKACIVITILALLVMLALLVF